MAGTPNTGPRPLVTYVIGASRARFTEPAVPADRCYNSDHIAVRIQRGGGNGPTKPRQPPERERCQFHQAPTTRPGRCGKGGFSTSDHRPRRRFFHICRQSLFAAKNARPPTRSTRATCASSASARSRSPTSRAPTTIPPRCAAGSRPARTRCGATPTSCRVAGAARAATLPARAGRRCCGRPAGRAARPARAVDQERRRQPDPLVQGPRRLGRAGPRPRARLRDDRLRLDRQPRQRRGRPRRRRRARVLRVHPGRPRGAEGARDRRLRHQPGRRPRQLRRRQPPLHRALGRARLGVREHQHAPVLRRGLQDARVRDRRAARVRAARPRGLPDRVGVAVHQDRARLRGMARAGAGRGRAADVQRRPGDRLLAGGDRVRRPARTSAVRSSPTRSPSRWRSATRPTAPTRSTSPGAAAARSTRSPTTRSARASSCSPRPPGSSPRPPAE